MSTLGLTTTCPACGAEESLDALVLRLVDDDLVRRLIADMLTHSLPVGGLVVSYLRLHKPAHQRLRLSRVQTLLAELVPDVRRGAITRKGRDWQAPLPAWQAAFAAVFEARDRGALTLPLDGNAYLYEIVMRMADQAESAQERQQHQERRTRGLVGPTPAGPTAVGLSLHAQSLPAVAGSPSAPSAGHPPIAAPAPAGPSLYARRTLAEIAERLGRRPASDPADSGDAPDTTHPTTPSPETP